MLPTFVIGLREGLEASLIVGIIAAFLARHGRRDLLRKVYAGVAVAVVLCAGVGIALRVVSADLPQRQQEGLETIVGLVAVAMVTYMVVWMRRHSRQLRGQLERAAASAVAAGSGMALVAMAFLAVLREGFETAVFLLAAFNESRSGVAAGVGAVLGIALAVALGCGIYRGGVRLNLSKFFRATGLVLVLVAGGLLVTAAHTAHEAGWLEVGQQATVDLSAVVSPGSVQSSLLTGMLGIQSRPVVAEVVVWLAYVVPVGLYVAWPPGRHVPRGRLGVLLFAASGISVAAAFVLVPMGSASPSRGATTTTADGVSAQLLASNGDTAAVRTDVVVAGRLLDVHVRRTAIDRDGPVNADIYTATSTSDPVGTRPARLSYPEVAALNGGRLPLGVQASAGTVPVSYRTTTDLVVRVARSSAHILDIQSRAMTSTTATFTIGSVTLDEGRSAVRGWSPVTVAAQTAMARAAQDTASRRDVMRAVGWCAAVAAIVLVLLGVATWPRRSAATPLAVGAPPSAPASLQT